jgi:hypothetical protein
MRAQGRLDIFGLTHNVQMFIGVSADVVMGVTGGPNVDSVDDKMDNGVGE